jgi:hypothetical protein
MTLLKSARDVVSVFPLKRSMTMDQLDALATLEEEITNIDHLAECRVIGCKTQSAIVHTGMCVKCVKMALDDNDIEDFECHTD